MSSAESPDPRRAVETAHLFRPLAGALIGLLRGLEHADWERPTSAAAWSVRDVAAHLLDVDLRRLSAARDGFLPPPPAQPLDSSAALVSYLNSLNAEWVHAARRLSPRVLIEHLELAATAVADLMEATDPRAEATFPVAWTGDAASPMWLDMGREFTERWHHQDQIRAAVGAEPLAGRDWLLPVLEISLFALPHTYRAVDRPEGTTLLIRLNGNVSGDWHLERERRHWALRAGATADPVCSVTADALQFARLLLHRLGARATDVVLEGTGDTSLAEPLMTARAVMV